MSTIAGKVVHGDGLGKKLGFPTANVEVSEPPRERGVFAVEAEGPALGGKRFGVCNIGVRPTVSGRKLVVEAHFLGFSGDLYGSVVTLKLLAKLRDERKFGSLDELKAQIALDIQASSSYNEVVTAPAPASASSDASSDGDHFNADHNLLGRLVALALIAGFLAWLGRFLSH